MTPNPYDLIILNKLLTILDKYVLIGSMADDSQIKKEIQAELLSPIIEALESEGITLPYLSKQLKKELKAKEIKVFNDKGTIIYSDGVPALDIQQRARIDAHKLRGDYPAEEHRITGEMVTSRSEAEIEELKKIADRVVEEIRSNKKD